MIRLSAQTPRDIKGYRWVNAGEYDPVDDADYYPDAVYLQGLSYAEWKTRLLKEGEVPFEYVYDPFVTEPALFRIFGQLDGSEEAILRFANEYGDIATHDEIFDEGGLTLADWRGAIERFSTALNVAENVAHVRRSSRNKPKAIDAAIELLGDLLCDVPVYFDATVKNGEIDLRNLVGCLYDVMKLQLAEAIVERKQYRMCDQCGKPFEINPQFNRSDRIFCSDNCRVKACYRRKKKAVELREQGESLRAIAEATGSDMKTLKSWLKNVDKKAK